MQIPTYEIMISNVGQIRGENVSSYNCENYFFVIVSEIETEFQKNISLIRYVIECWFKIFIQNTFESLQLDSNPEPLSL